MTKKQLIEDPNFRIGSRWTMTQKGDLVILSCSGMLDLFIQQMQFSMGPVFIGLKGASNAHWVGSWSALIAGLGVYQSVAPYLGEGRAVEKMADVLVRGQGHLSEIDQLEFREKVMEWQKGNQ